MRPTRVATRSAANRSPCSAGGPSTRSHADSRRETTGRGRAAMREWVDHTSEVELRVEAPSAEEAVAEATAALGEMLGEAGDETVTRQVEVEAGDAAGLLAAWLEELVFLAEHERLIALQARRGGVEPGRLRAEGVAGRGGAAHLGKAGT